MRLVRLGDEPSKVGVDIRAAVSAWGEGCGVLGGVAVFGITPPGSPRPLDAVIVLPRGVIAVIGTDLPQPALKLEAPLQTPWLVDGWPLVRNEGAVNPALEAVESASALARALQSRGVDPLPVATMVVVGPFVEQVTQPTNDLHRGLRVVPPSTTSMLAAARELATYERACPIEAIQRLLSVLDEQTGRLGNEVLSAEGFPDVVTRDLATAATMLLPKIGRSSPVNRSIESIRKVTGQLSRRAQVVTGAVALLLACGIVTFLLFMVRPSDPAPAPTAEPTSRVDGVEFVLKTSNQDAECAMHSFGDVQAWFAGKPCAALTRSAFDASVSGKPAAVAVAVVELPDEASAAELRDLLDGAGTGGITDPLTDGGGWAGAPQSFDNAAQSVEQVGTEVRVVRAVWSRDASDPDDVRLRALAERGLRLPAQP